MSELFRVTVIRRPRPAAIGEVIPVEPGPNFEGELKAALAGPEPRADAIAASTALVARPLDEPVFVLEPEVLAVLAALEDDTLHPVRADVRARFTVELRDPRDIIEVVADRIIALTLAGTNASELRRLGRYRRGLWIYQLVTDRAPVDAAKVDDALARAPRAPLVLPRWLELPAKAPAATEVPAPEDSKVREELAATHEELAATLSVAEELAKLPRGSFVPAKTHEILPPSRVLSADAVARLRPQTTMMLKSVGIDPTATDLKITVRELAKRAETLQAKTTKLEAQLPKWSSDALVKIGTEWRNPLNNWPAPAPPPSNAILPVTALPLYRVGVGELYTITHSLKAYRGGEVALVENVLIGETRTRDHRTLLRTEAEVTSENERSEVDERSVEATTRFELQVEASRVVKEDQEVKAGFGLNADFGSVELETNLDYTYKKSAEESEKLASKLGRDVVEKAANKVTERVLERRISRTTTEIEDKDFHSFDNREGDHHITGVYQWIDKVYHVQVWRHDDRAYTMYDLVVPTPAALLLAAYATGPKLPQGVVMPPAFINVDDPKQQEELGPDHITESNYLKYAARYHVTTLEPPPPVCVTLSAPVVLTNSAAGDGDKEITPLASATKDLQIPSGYYAVTGHVVADGVADASQTAEIEMFVGGERVNQPSGSETFKPSESDGTLAIAMLGKNIRAAAGNVVVVCMRSNEALVRWKVKTYAAIRQAYEKELATYNEAVAIATTTDIDVGTNPLDNRQVIERELHRCCLALLTQQNFDSFGAINRVDGAPPAIDFNRAAIQGPYIRFFEDAFEWSKMTFFCYPYFWAGVNKDDPAWAQRARLKDADPLFAEFLRAGAARVILPVKKGYEAALEAAFRGERPWETPVSDTALSQMSADLVAEAEARDQPNRTATPTKSWEVVVPSTLVKLRTDDKLPVFSNPSPGVYVPSDP